MKITVNEQRIMFRQGSTIAELAALVKPGADLFVINGFPVGPETTVQPEDICWVIKKGEVPSAQEMKTMLYARHTPGVQEKLEQCTVGIMGLGGLGSLVAVALARIGIGKMVMADYDVIDPTNLNRQQYFCDQIGMKKTAALRQNIVRINPYVILEVHDVLLTEENIPQIFNKVDALAECFDDPRMKAAGLRAARNNLPNIAYVGSSGLAGYGDNNTIRTKKLFPGVYIVGDGETAAGPGVGLMAPRVGIAAHHQANQIVRLLLGVADKELI